MEALKESQLPTKYYTHTFEIIGETLEQHFFGNKEIQSECESQSQTDSVSETVGVLMETER